MEKIIIGLAGEMASGKGTIAKYIEEKHQGNAYGFSTSLRDVAKRMHLEDERETLQKISQFFRESFNSDILSEVVFRDVEKDEGKLIVIDGIRRLADITYFQKLPGFKLIYVEAEIEKRYERITQRKQNVDDESKTFEQFKADHEREAELQIKQLKDHADFVIDNNGSLEDLHKQVDEIIKEK